MNLLKIKSVLFLEKIKLFRVKSTSLKSLHFERAGPKPPNRGALETSKMPYDNPALVVRIFCEHMGWHQFFIILRRSFRTKSKILI